MKPGGGLVVTVASTFKPAVFDRVELIQNEINPQSASNGLPIKGDPTSHPIDIAIKMISYSFRHLTTAGIMNADKGYFLFK